MKFLRLLDQSKAQLQEHSLSLRGFQSGGEWMSAQLRSDDVSASANSRGSVNFFAYGFFKYGISLLAFALAVYFLFQVSIWLLPLSVPVFYFVEIHFLFLFPLLIDGAEKPLTASITQTYRTGIFTSLITVMFIGIYMMTGLLRVNDPFRNWYIGCLAVVCWYKDEIRNRI